MRGGDVWSGIFPAGTRVGFPGLLVALGFQEAVIEGFAPGCHVFPARLGMGWGSVHPAGSSPSPSHPHHLCTGKAGDALKAKEQDQYREDMWEMHN